MNALTTFGAPQAMAGMMIPSQHTNISGSCLSAISPTSQRVPAYGKDVLSKIEAGRSPNVYIFTGPNAWERALRRLASHGPGSVMLLPPGEDAASYRWPPVAGGAVLDAREVDRRTAVRVATVIVSAGTPMVFVVREREGFSVRSRSWCNPLQVAA